MKNILLILLFVGSLCFSQGTPKSVQGKITDGSNAIENVSVKISDDAKAIFSDSQGKYKIAAEAGDVIVFSYQGLKTVNIRVEDVTRFLNITMIPDVEELEEVIVKGSNRKSQRELELEYPTNPNLIRTAFGYLNADTAPGKIQFLSEEEINTVNLCILDLLRNQFAGIRVQGECSGAFGPSFGGEQNGPSVTGRQEDNQLGVIGLVTASGTGVNSSLNQGKVFVRGASSLLNQRSAIFDVDGQIMNTAPLWLDIANIKRLAILNNFATATSYGSAGAGGVIVVNTISGSPQSDKIYDLARLRNNFFNGTVVGQSDLKRNDPNYLKDLEHSSSLGAAKEVYQKYAKIYSGSPYFFLDAQKYFTTKWNEKSFSDDIIDSHLNLFKKNPVLLKALAYQYEEQGALEQSNQIFKKVLKLRPNYAQSYLDMANSYRDLKNTQQAASLYTRYSYLLDQGLMQADSVGFTPIFEREYNNFLYLNKNAILDGHKASNLYVAAEDFEGTRVVFEWNDSEAEFELQFVNPENQYAMMKHSLADNADMISKEKEFGYSVAEYLIDASLPGSWKVNINYLGNKSLTPTYLKATVYHNYGTFAQRKKIKVFKLGLKNVVQELFTISVGSKLAFNN